METYLMLAWLLLSPIGIVVIGSLYFHISYKHLTKEQQIKEVKDSMEAPGGKVYIFIFLSTWFGIGFLIRAILQ